MNVLPLFGFGKDSCRVKTTFSMKWLMSEESQLRTNSSQSWVKPSWVTLLFRLATWPTSKLIFTADIV